MGDGRAAPWTNERGEEVSDVGGRLLAALNTRRIAWREILRSNSVNLHPVLYGIYEDHIYHHGAGFRAPLSRADRNASGDVDQVWLPGHAKVRSLRKLRHRHIVRLLRASGQVFRAKQLRRTIRDRQQESEKIFQQICSDPSFYRQFEEQITDPANFMS
jgi:hypothetical protein